MAEILLSISKASFYEKHCLCVAFFIVLGRSELLVANQGKSMISDGRISTKSMDLMNITNLDRQICEMLFRFALFIVILYFWLLVHKQKIS